MHVIPGVEGVGGDSSAALFEGENGERGLVAVAVRLSCCADINSHIASKQ